MFSRVIAVATIVVSLSYRTALSAAPPVPAPPADVGYDVLDAFTYTQTEAQRLWRPMTGSKGVRVVDIGGRKALQLPCNFQGTDIERASWDRLIKLDLTDRRGIQFMMYSRNAAPVGHFSLYFHSGDGWYSATFTPPPDGRWGAVRIDKSATRIEGRPGGWGRIDRVRISAWRGRDVDTELHIAALGMLGEACKAKLVVVRGDWAARQNPGEARAVAECAQRVTRLLDGLGQPYMVLSDLDVTAERLRDREIVILPFSPGMSDSVARRIAAFVQSGGKVACFYHVHPYLREAVGITGGAHVRQKYRGYFHSIRPSAKPLVGLPDQTRQASWNIHRAQPVAGKARVAAWWFDDKGTSTGEPALVVSDRCAFLTHILLPDDPANKARLLLAMLGHLQPKLWADAAEAAMRQIGRLGPYRDFAAAEKDLRRQAGADPAALAVLDDVKAIRDRAEKLRAEGKFSESVAAAGRARTRMVGAYCAVQKPRKGEHRALWCHSAFGVAGMSWDQAIKRLADNGFTAVLPNMLWGGVAFYRSEVLPVSPQVKDKGDQVALCVAACKKYGLECHVWKVNYNMGWATPKDFAARMKAEGRTQVNDDATPNDRWLCPSHPANQKLEIDSMLEVARKYDVDGLHFDYIRYPNNRACYCDGCRKRLAQAVGRKIDKWPADLRKAPQLRRQWLDFRRRQITTVVAAVAEGARKIKPGIRISAAVFRNWPVDRDSIGQDWKLWCEKGYLDFCCPMDYTPDSRALARMITDQLKWCGKVPCCPGIGVSVWPDPTDIVKLIEQIHITRRLGTGGFTIFNYDPTVAEHIVPLAGLGITRKQ